MIMNNWKFLINRLLFFIGMIGSFIGATLGFGNILIENIGLNLFISLMIVEFIGLTIIYFLLLVAIIDFIKDNKKRKDK